MQIRSMIREKYRAVSRSAQGLFKYPVGRKGAALLGYDTTLLGSVPGDLLDSFCGVGNPFSIAPIRSGSTVLDVGCGAGFDLYTASRLVGEKGRVAGVDLTEEMVWRARDFLERLGGFHSEIHLVLSETLPFSDETFDVVISNGVINLSPDKPRLFNELYRVIKPGGSLQFADIILEKDFLPPVFDPSSWSQ